MKSIIKWCIGNPVFVNLAVILVVISGFLFLQFLNREMFPEFSLDRIMIRVVFPGASPEEVEEGICIKIEEAISGITGIKRIDSKAVESVGTVSVEIEAGQDIYRLKDEIESQVNQINTFPVDAERPITQDMKIIRQVLFVTVSGDLSEENLRSLVEEVKDDLLQTPEISQISIQGLRNYEVSIELSEEMMRKYQVNSQEIAEAIRHNSLDLSGGILKTEQGEVLVRVKGQKYVRNEFEDIIVKTSASGAHVYLHQIARVKDDFQETQVRGYFNGKRAAQISIFKTVDEDIIKIANRVYKYIAEKQKKLPPGVRLDILSDSSKMVQSRLDLLKNNGLQGLALVFICLALFLNFRVAFWVAWGIPMSFLGTFIVLVVLGQSLNMLSLFALIMALGMIVDDAIVFSESIYTEMYQNHLPPREAAYVGTVHMIWPVIGSITTTIAAFLPLLCVTGIMGKFIAVIPITVVSCLVVSLVEAMIMLPSHLAQTLPPVDKEQRKSLGRAIRVKIDSMVDFVLQKYGIFVRFTCEFRYATLGMAICILLGCFGLIQGGFVKFVLFQKMDTDFITVKLSYPEGTSDETTAKTIFYIEKQLMQLNESLKKEFHKQDDVVLKVYTTVGQQTGESTSSGSNLAEINVELMPLETRNIPSEVILNRWREATGDIPGVTSLRFGAMSGGPGGKPIQVQLRSNDFSNLRRASLELRDHLKRYPGLYDIDDDFSEGYKELRLSLKPEARNLNLNLYDLATQVRYAFYGNEILRLQRGKFDVKVFLRYPKSERAYLSDINTIMIRTAAGFEVPISEVADMQVTNGYSVIRRTENKRIINVMSDLDERKANAYEINEDLVKSGYLAALCSKYPGVSYAFEGQRKETTESLSGLFTGFAIAILGIYMILATIFASYFQPILIMITIPFGLVGVILGHLHMGYPLTMMSLFGVVALAGVVVNNAIVMIDFINEELSKNTPVLEAVVNSGVKRFRAIFLTSTTTILGVSTLMLGGSLQAQYLIPMALTLAYGLLFSTILTLVILPACFLILTDIIRIFSWIMSGKWKDAKELYGR